MTSRADIADLLDEMAAAATRPQDQSKLSAASQRIRRDDDIEFLVAGDWWGHMGSFFDNLPVADELEDELAWLLMDAGVWSIEIHHHYGLTAGTRHFGPRESRRWPHRRGEVPEVRAIRRRLEELGYPIKA